MPPRIDSLAQRQQQLVEQVFFRANTISSFDTNQQKGLTIYQNNLLFTASRALQLTYPVLTQLLGQEAIKNLAHTLLSSSPPTTGNWADWGQPLKDIISANPLVTTYPFLPDVVALEWAVHQSGRSNADISISRSLSSIESGNVLQATIHLSPAVRLLTSNYPVDQIWKAHQTTNGRQTFDETAFAEAIQQHQGSCHLLIFQQDRQPLCIRVTEAEMLWLTDITAKFTIGELLDKHPQFDLIQWLTDAITQNWISTLTFNAHQTVEGEAP